MTTLLAPNQITIGEPGWSPDEAQLAAAAFLARYRGRTLEAYQYDLRSFFQWAHDHHLDVLAATRAHLEWYRTAMEQQGLAAASAYMPNAAKNEILKSVQRSALRNGV